MSKPTRGVTAKAIKAKAEEALVTHEFDPIEWLTEVVVTGVIPQTGENVRPKARVTVATRLLPYFHAQKAAVDKDGNVAPLIHLDCHSAS